MSSKKKTKSPKKDTCTLKHEFAIEASQKEARCVAMGGFMPRSVADKLIAAVEAQYAFTAERERVYQMAFPI